MSKPRQVYRVHCAGVPRHVFGTAHPTDVTDFIVQVKSGLHSTLPRHSDLSVEKRMPKGWTGLAPASRDRLSAEVRRRLTEHTR